MNDPKLTIELVPKTCWYSNVRSNVPKATWDIIRKQGYADAGHVCEVCGGIGPRWPVECHEIWEYNDDEHIQRLAGMIALCPPCHQVKHIGRTSQFGGYRPAIRHLANVNGWTSGEAEQYVQEQLLIWEERSHHEWLLDLLELNRYLDDHLKTGEIEWE